MATPAMSPANVTASITPASAGVIRINTFDAAGAALNVSSGYTLDFVKAVPASDANPLATPVDIASSLSAAFDATGVNLSFTAAQASAIAAALGTVRSSVGIGLSNDSSTTATLAAVVALTIRPEPQLKA